MLFGVLGGFESGVGWLSGDSVTSTQVAMSQIEAWYSSIPLLGNTTFQQACGLLAGMGFIWGSIVLLGHALLASSRRFGAPAIERKPLPVNINTAANAPLPGLRIVEKSRGVDGGRAMIQDLIDEAPLATPLNRQSVARWSRKCIDTLRELMADDYQDEWMKISAKFALVEKKGALSAAQVKDRLDGTLIQLKALITRFNHTMLRRVSNMTNGEYSQLYPSDRP